VPSTKWRRISRTPAESIHQKKKSSHFSVLYFSQALRSPATTSDNRSPFAYVCLRVCRSVLYKYIQKEPPARARLRKKRHPFPREDRLDRRAEKDPSFGRVQRVPLPAFSPLLHSYFFLSFRHSEYVVPILTGVPFSSVKMKNQKALDLRSSA